MTIELTNQLVGNFVRISFTNPFRWENTGDAFVAGWCKACWDEGLLIAEVKDTTKAVSPTFIPWTNIAGIRLLSVEDLNAQNEAAKAEFLKEVKPIGG